MSTLHVLAARAALLRAALEKRSSEEGQPPLVGTAPVDPALQDGQTQPPEPTKGWSFWRRQPSARKVVRNQAANVAGTGFGNWFSLFHNKYAPGAQQ